MDQMVGYCGHLSFRMFFCFCVKTPRALANTDDLMVIMVDDDALTILDNIKILF